MKKQEFYNIYTNELWIFDLLSGIYMKNKSEELIYGLENICDRLQGIMVRLEQTIKVDSSGREYNFKQMREFFPNNMYVRLYGRIEERLMHAGYYGS